MSEPSKEALEAAREWWHCPVGDEASLARLLDAHFAAGEARGLKRAANVLSAQARQDRNVQKQLGIRGATSPTIVSATVCEDGARAIRALKPEGRPR